MTTPLLVDSCSYFRLARIIEPLLGVELGDPPFKLLVIPELDEEFGKSPHLQEKFPWVNEAKFRDNRIESVLEAGKSKFSIRETTRFFKDHKYNRGLGVSKVDIQILVVGYLSNTTIVSDDADVREMVSDFEMTECMSSLEVLLWLYEEEILTLRQIKAGVKVWRAERDLGMATDKFINTFIEYFGVSPW